MEQTRDQIRAYYASWFRINKLYSTWAQQYGMQYTTLLMLYNIKKSEQGCTQRQLCENMVLPKQTVSLAIAGLEKKGIVYQMQMEKDRRNKLVKFTREGRIFAGKILEELESAEQEAYVSMPKEQREAMTIGLSNLASQLEKSFLCHKKKS